jgi:hypothetical protein
LTTASATELPPVTRSELEETWAPRGEKVSHEAGSSLLDYPHQLAVHLNLTAVRWVPPACLVLIFILLFFPWVGLYAGDRMLLRQSGWGVAFGGMTHYTARFLADLNPGVAVIVLLYFFLICLGLLAVVALALGQFAPERLHVDLPPWLKGLVAWRSFLLGSISILGFVFLLPHCFVSFPFERMLLSNAGEVYEATLQAVKNLDVDKASLLTEPFLQRRSWYYAVVFLNLLAVFGSLGDFWLARRGNRPPPRMEVAW